MSGQKILLITPPNEGQTRDYTTPSFYGSKPVRYMPLGILAVATSVSDRHKVEVLDAASFDLSIDDSVNRIKAIKPDVLGISVVTSKAYPMAEILRSVEEPIKVVGGPHVTHYAEETIALGADAVFKHDADRNFNKWLDEGCKSGIYEDHIKDYDSLSIPKRGFLNIEDYAIKEGEADKTLFKTAGARLSMCSSRGCPFRCVFCDVQEKIFRDHSPVHVVDEMEYLLYIGGTSVHILDDCFNVKRKRVLDICAEIKRRKLKFNWSVRGRVNFDDEVARAYVETGCNRIHVGVENLDPDILEWMNKKTDVDTIQNFFELCNKYGIETVAYFILGSPMETREYREKLPEMIRKLGVIYPYFNILYPASHTKYYETLLEDGIYERDYWQDFAEKPTTDFEIPLPRTPELQAELYQTVRKYIEMFYGVG